MDIFNRTAIREKKKSLSSGNQKKQEKYFGVNSIIEKKKKILNLLQVIPDYPCQRKSTGVWIIGSKNNYKNHYTLIYILRRKNFTLNLFYYIGSNSVLFKVP